jgi:hypothetical protein
MKATAWLTTALILAAMTWGCGQKSHSPEVTAENLQKSFEKSEPSVAQEVREASTAFQGSNYTQAILIMDRVAQARPMDANQKKAIDDLIIQTRQAAQQNPKLDSPQLYQALSDLQLRVHGEN